jgi:predicted nucleotidyltransferase
VPLRSRYCGTCAPAECGRVVFGSLAAGRFMLHSDVDFIVLTCPRALRYGIEASIEDRMRGIPFDVVYADEMREPWRSRALAAVREESALRQSRRDARPCGGAARKRG